MLTLFSCPKPFRGHIGLIQRNAICSWACLKPKPEIILFGDEEGTGEISRELGLRHVPAVACNEFGRPLISDIFETAQRTASFEALCFVNADIILLSDFLEAVNRVRRWRSGALVSGGRWNVEIRDSIPFENPEWESRLRKQKLEHGQLEIIAADYFVFDRGFYLEIPPFAIGRVGYDNWLIWRALKMKAPVVDITPSVVAIHQNHWTRESLVAREALPDTRSNLELVGYWRRSHNMLDARYVLTEDGVSSRYGAALRHRLQSAMDPILISVKRALSRRGLTRSRLRKLLCLRGGC